MILSIRREDNNKRDIREVNYMKGRWIQHPQDYDLTADSVFRVTGIWTFSIPVF
jgi:hypothetical protein